MTRNWVWQDKGGVARGAVGCIGTYPYPAAVSAATPPSRPLQLEPMDSRLARGRVSTNSYVLYKIKDMR